MAALDGCVAEPESCAPPASSCIVEGPVLTLMNKRLRALKKKYNRILQIEEGKVQGKTINKEQEEVLKSKITVAVLIDEYEKLRQPLAIAVKEEVVEREKELMEQRKCEEEGGVQEKEEVGDSRKGTLDEVRQDLEVDSSALCNGSSTPDNLNGACVHTERENKEALSNGAVVLPDEVVADLLKLLYIAQLFDLRAQGDASSLVWTKVHERSSCLSYDFVTEDSTSPLCESDLDALSLFGSLLTSRPPDTTLSHRDALQQCIERAVLWLERAECYSHLRERLNRILSSEYFTMTPEMKTLNTVSQQTAVATATGVGQYTSQILIHDPSVNASALESEGSTIYFSHQDPATAPLLFQAGESYAVSGVDNAKSDVSNSHMDANPDAPCTPETNSGNDVPQADGILRDVSEELTLPEVPKEQQVAPSDEPSQNEELEEQSEEQQSHVNNVSVGPRGFQGPKGGGRGYNHGPGVRGRGYMNARGRAGRGLYGNGRGGQYYDQGGYYPRNQYGRGSGRGIRGGGPIYNGYANGPANGQAAQM